MINLRFHDQLAEAMHLLSDRSLTHEERLDVSISLSNLLLVRIEELQDFILSKDLTEDDFQEYIRAQSGVTYH